MDSSQAANDPGPPPRPNSRRSLLAGTSILALLLLANVSAYIIPTESSRVDVRYEPPHVLWLQRLLWQSDARDTVTHLLGLAIQAPAPNGVFTTTPSATARIGQSYEYQPRSRQPLASYSLEGEVPDGLAVDPVTGAISGSPASKGKYDVILAASLGDDRRAEQHFTLYVDDRLLIFGADGMGRDVLRRLLAATRYTFLPGLIAVLIGVGGGAIIGALGGFYAGLAHQVQRAITAVIQSVPGLLIVFLTGAIFGYNIYILMIVVGVILLPETASGVMERVESFRQREFVEAARELGLRDRTILWNEIVWHNARTFLLTKVTQGFVYAILVGVTLSYIGLTDRSLPQIGGMLLEGRDAMINETTSALAPVALGALLLVISGFSLTERGIRQLYERKR